MKKNLLKWFMAAIILGMPLMQICAQSFSGGSGTEEDPYQIASVTDLKAMKTQVDLANNSTAGKFYVLMNDIDMTEVNDWFPIGLNSGTHGGSANFDFQGTFDGNGHTIENLSYNWTGGGLAGGLFGRFAKATVENLTLKNFNISATQSAQTCIGALAAVIFQGGTTIENVAVVNCKITGTTSGANFNEVGGLVGRTTEQGTTTISNCYVDAQTVISNAGTTSTGNIGVGGLIGRHNQVANDGGAPADIRVTNCYVAATIEEVTKSATANACGLLAAEANVSATLSNDFVMAKAKSGTTLQPFCSTAVMATAAGNYFACSDAGYFPDVASGNAKTLSELQTEATYSGVGWDFNEIWQIKEGEFPIFKWQTYTGGSGIGAVNAAQSWSVKGEKNRIEVTVSEPLFLSVFDLAGKTLFAAQVNNQVSIPANQGIYILKLKSAGKEAVQKITVK